MSLEKRDVPEVLKSVIDNIEKVIVGKTDTIELIITALLAGGHVLIEDIPGIGKTTLVKAIAKSIDLSFGRIQCTPDILPSDITGFTMYNIKTGEMEYKEGSVFNNIILADEINRASPKTQSSLLEVMEENQVTIDGNTRFVPKPFMMLATQNPVEYLGTFPLPEAQLDRFMIKVSMGYPGYNNELLILDRFAEDSLLDDLKPVTNAEDIFSIQRFLSDVYMGKAIKKYILDLVDKTRHHSEIVLGASPRASIQLLKASQAYSLLKGKDYISPDVVKKLAVNVLSHRIMLRSESKLKGAKREEIIRDILDTVKVPVE